MTSKIKNLALSTAAKVSAFSTLAIARANYLVYCEDKKKDAAATGAFDDAIKASGKLQDQLFALSKALFPLAIVICGVAMFFTRDQKKFDAEKHILIGCCLAFALIVLVDKGNVVDTVINIVNPGK